MCKLTSAAVEFKLSQQASGKASLENTNAPSPLDWVGVRRRRLVRSFPTVP